MAINRTSRTLDDLIRVAQYVRMSTEHQQYSIDNQAEAIRRYAEAHKMEIVKTYTDSGKSGLTIQNRPGLKQLIDDVELGSSGYSAVLVYDVSRWGRFQDADESAYYEYRCRRANIGVHYCAEPFFNDGSLAAALLKTLKRTMAAEVQPRTFREGLCRPIEAHRTWVSPGRDCGIWVSATIGGSEW